MPTKFLRNRFFGREFTFATPHVDIDLVMPKRGMAPFVHPSLPGKATASQGFTMKTYVPPTLKPNKIITPEHLGTRLPGATIYDESPDVQLALASLIGERIAEINDEIAFRCEWMAAQALFTGSIPVVGEGYNQTIDFGLLNTHNITLLNAAKWDQNTSTPWTDLQSACRLNRDDGQVVSDTAVFGSNAWALFRDWLSTEANKKYLDMVNMQLGMVSPTPVDKYTTYCGTIRDADMVLDLFTYSAQYLDGADNMQPYVPADEVFIGSTQATGNQELYGGIQSLYVPSGKTKLFIDSQAKKNPESIEILPQSKPLITLLEPKAGTRIKVK
ncbi:MAG: major capsid protein, partial [Actinomycetota bacterium]